MSEKVTYDIPQIRGRTLGRKKRTEPRPARLEREREAILAYKMAFAGQLQENMQTSFGPKSFKRAKDLTLPKITLLAFSPLDGRPNSSETP